MSSRIAFLASALLAAGCAASDVARIPAGAPGEAPPGMVWIPGGEFEMGAEDDEFATAAEKPAHRVFVDGFFMDVHTVTNAEFRAFVAATGYVTLAERAPDVAELLKQLRPGTPPPHDP